MPQFEELIQVCGPKHRKSKAPFDRNVLIPFELEGPELILLMMPDFRHAERREDRQPSYRRIGLLYLNDKIRGRVYAEFNLVLPPDEPLILDVIAFVCFHSSRSTFLAPG